MKHQDYLSENLTSEDIFTNPQFKFDTRGRAVLTMPGQDTLTLSVTPGSKIISHAASTYTNKPATDPASIRTGALHATTVITVGNSIYLDAPNSRITVGEDGGTQWIMDKKYLRGVDNEQTVFGFFLTDVSLGDNKEFSKGDVLIGNYPDSYLRYDCSNRRLLIVGDVAMAGDVVSVNFATGVSGYKLEYVTGNAEFSNVVVRGTSTIGGTLASAIGTAIDNSAHLVTDIINARLDSSSKAILSDFTFGPTDYAGALKSGSITWNTTTGAITGGSGVVVYRNGIVGANTALGVTTTTFTLDATTGAATFAGALSAPSGNISSWTIGAAELSSGKVKLQSTAERILLGDATAPMTGVGIFMGKDGTDYEFRAGNPSGDYIHFDGTTLTIVGAIDISSKLDKVGGDYQTTATGARLLIFPDANTGIQIINASSADVFKAIIGGTDSGDVIFGNYSGSQGILWDQSAGTLNVKGNITMSSGSITWASVTGPDYTNVQGTKPPAGATVGATWGVNIDGSNKPADNATVGATLGTNVSGGSTSTNYISNSGYITAITADSITTGTLTVGSSNVGIYVESGGDIEFESTDSSSISEIIFNRAGVANKGWNIWFTGDGGGGIYNAGDLQFMPQSNNDSDRVRFGSTGQSCAVVVHGSMNCNYAYATRVYISTSGRLQIPVGSDLYT